MLVSCVLVPKPIFTNKGVSDVMIMIMWFHERNFSRVY